LLDFGGDAGEVAQIGLEFGQPDLEVYELVA
jgi:hypothetical protein